MAFRDKQRVIYTSPLKALSNQKYRELSEEFGDVSDEQGVFCLLMMCGCTWLYGAVQHSQISSLAI